MRGLCRLSGDSEEWLNDCFCVRRILFHFLSDCCVEKIVDFFREKRGEIQNSPLAKSCSFLLRKSTPYLSITIRRVHSSVGRLPAGGTTRGNSLGYPQNQVKKL
jgi:hypothetical protein